MAGRVLTAALAASALLAPVFGADSLKGSRGSKCPKDSPCGGLYADCGVGAFCLGGCDVTISHSKEACVPNPKCKSGTYKMGSLDDVQSIDKYLGDSSKINWQGQGKPVLYEDSTLLTMAEGTVGTLMASTHYVWYGKICAKMTTSQGKGVVTAFIMMSDVKDEIDFEWVGTDIANVQTNYYSQGVTNYKNGRNLTIPNGNSVEKLHEYCMDWKEDTLTWSIDGNDLRTLNRKDTWNATAGRFDYPQTPSRVMLSLWPAGLPSNEKGTIDWAGGVIDWNSPYMQNGYYYARVQQVTIECYGPPSGAKKSGDKSYIYTDDKNPTNNTIEITDKEVILGSLFATGEDPKFGAVTASGAPQPTRSAATVPGGNPGGGNRAEDQSSAASAGPSGTAAPSGSSTPNNGAGGQGFNQNTGGNGGSAGTALQPGLGKVGGGAFAIVVAVLGLMVL
ncbi:concanavalin A-like lectin/glucanase domain-containing protein [Dendryphion nanum]|uniref:Concanavalin A-like lectin/glucanase domain-containing protein n=1 Tax=Dendryphion nanum TaxID=256645 RepID=A0A9P9IIK5_9PLEO|nr:concanavalin A-like lectin/glucanase domain-containing protein [Dendryphion nanum]